MIILPSSMFFFIIIDSWFFSCQSNILISDNKVTVELQRINKQFSNKITYLKIHFAFMWVQFRKLLCTPSVVG